MPIISNKDKWSQIINKIDFCDNCYLVISITIKRLKKHFLTVDLKIEVLFFLNILGIHLKMCWRNTYRNSNNSCKVEIRSLIPCDLTSNSCRLTTSPHWRRWDIFMLHCAALWCMILVWHGRIVHRGRGAIHQIVSRGCPAFDEKMEPVRSKVL